MAHRMMTSSMTSRNHERSRSWSQYLQGPLFRKRLEIDSDTTGTYRRWHARYRMVTWSMTSRDPEVKVVISIPLRPVISKTARDRDSVLTGHHLPLQPYRVYKSCKKIHLANRPICTLWAPSTVCASCIIILPCCTAIYIECVIYKQSNVANNAVYHQIGLQRCVRHIGLSIYIYTNVHTGLIKTFRNRKPKKKFLCLWINRCHSFIHSFNNSVVRIVCTP